MASRCCETMSCQQHNTRVSDGSASNIPPTHLQLALRCLQSPRCGGRRLCRTVQRLHARATIQITRTRSSDGMNVLRSHLLRRGGNGLDQVLGGSRALRIKQLRGPG
jgi:hypothetical protein